MANDNILRIPVGMVKPLVVRNFLRDPKHRRPLVFLGPPGCGKTASVSQAVEELTSPTNPVGLVESILGMLDITDVRFPVVIKNKMDFYYNSEFPLQGNASKFPSKGIWFLDEITNTEPTIQKIFLQVLQKGMLGEERMIEGWFPVAAGNQTTHKTYSLQLSAALVNRCVVFYVEPNVDDFVKWGLSHGLHELVVAYVRFQPQHLYMFDSKLFNAGDLAFPSLRSWEGVSDVTHDMMGEAEYAPIVRGLIGQGIGRTFLDFAEVRHKVPDLDAICEGRACPLPPKNDPATMFAIVAGLVHRSNPTTLHGILPYMERFPTEFQMLYLKDAGRKNPLLVTTKVMTTWMKKVNL